MTGGIKDSVRGEVSTNTCFFVDDILIFYDVMKRELDKLSIILDLFVMQHGW